MIKGYQNEYGIFNASYFMEELLKNQLKKIFSGAGASHQNGAAERVIKTVVTMEMTMLMHTTLRCLEDALYSELWPIAMDYAAWVYNLIPDMHSGLSDIEI